MHLVIKCCCTFIFKNYDRNTRRKIKHHNNCMSALKKFNNADICYVIPLYYFKYSN